MYTRNPYNMSCLFSALSLSINILLSIKTFALSFLHTSKEISFNSINCNAIFQLFTGLLQGAQGGLRKERGTTFLYRQQTDLRGWTCLHRRGRRERNSGRSPCQVGRI